MKIIKYKNKKQLSSVIKIIEEGGVVVFPTETVYGLGADPFNKLAISKIYDIKARSDQKALPLIADSLATVKKYFVLNPLEKKLIKKYWPGPLTLILTPKNKFTHLTSNKIAVRVSSNPVATALAEAVGGLIISTSANLSAHQECATVSAVAKQFLRRWPKPDLAIDIGRLQKQLPSTIIQIKNNKIQILRAGAVKI